jgi:tellurite methyltransferase
VSADSDFKSQPDKKHRPDIKRWNDRYQKLPADVEPLAEPELADCERFLEGNGLALEVASGKGANALYLASIGYRVIALDCAINGLKLAAQAARKHNLVIHQAVVDLKQMLLPGQTFDLISVIRYLERSLFEQLVAALKPGGLLFYKTFNQAYLETHPGFNPDYVLDNGELQTVFTDLEILASDSAKNGNRSTSSYILGRKK